MARRQTAPGAVLLVLVTCWAAANAQVYGDFQLSFGIFEPAEHVSTEAPSLQYCAEGDKCCVHNNSPADCVSTASRNKGCRSDSNCVPQADPCSAAANETGCIAVGKFCKFDINTFTCKLDAASHPCAAIKEASSCQASTAGCKVQHVCRDSCSSCPSCLDAMKAFARMPPVLAQLESESSSSSRRDRDEFFDDEEQEEEAVVAVQKLEDHQTTGFLKGYCHAAASGVLRASQEELMAGCARVAEDVARSPALLSRPAALCKRLGQCHTNCLVDGTTGSNGNINGNSSSSSPASSGPAKNNGSAGQGAAPVASGPILTPPAKDAIDMCSPTGLASGAAAGQKNKKEIADPSKAREGSACLSSADCPAGMDCDTFSHSECWPKCDKETGMDTCLSAGQCVDICQRPDIKVIVEESQRRYRPCTSSANCAKGEECGLPEFACTMVQCNPHAISRGLDFVEFVACPKICMAESPRMVNATFSDDGMSIKVVLNQEAAPMNSLCSFVFDDTTSDLLGSASICTTEGNILTIWLAGDVKVRAGRHALTLNEPNALFTSAFGLGSPGGAPIFSGALQRIAPCANCSASAIDLRLLGPTEIAMGCENDIASAEAEVDSTFMETSPFTPLNGEGFRFVALPPSSNLWMIQDLTWGVDSTANVSVAAVHKLVTQLNNKTNNWDRQVLNVPFSLLKLMPEGPITLTANITNVFGVKSTSSLTLRKKNATEAPLFELDHSLQSFFPSAGFRVDSNPLPSACPNARVTFRWSSTIPNVDLSDATSSSVAFTPQDLLGNVQIGKTYTVTLTAAYEGSTGTHSESITLTAAGSPLSVNLTGPSGTVPLKGAAPLVYDARGSVDPDDPFNTASQLSFLWSCTNTVDLTPCFGKQVDGTWVLDPTQLKEDVRYVVSVTVAKGDRSATASRSIIPGSGKGLSAQVHRSCGVDVATGAHLPCPSRHNPTDPLTLIAVPEAPFSLEDMLLEWWYDPLTVPHVQLSENNTASGIDLPSLTVLPDGLPNGGAITINVNFSLNPLSPKLQQQDNASGGAAVPSKNFSGTSSLTVPLNGPPYCSSPSSECITLDRSVATFPNTSFKACAVSWADPEKSQLTYEFGTLSASSREQVAVSTRASSNCFTFASLPTGPTTLYACAVDSMNARSCQEVDVAVLAPSTPVSSADVDQQLKKLNEELDSEQQAGSGAQQPGALVDKAMQVTSLLTSTTKQAVEEIADVVDTTVSGFKGLFNDIKKAFDNGISFSFNTGFGLLPDAAAAPAANADGAAPTNTTPSPTATTTTPPAAAPAPVAAAKPKLLMASRTSRFSRHGGSSPTAAASTTAAAAAPASADNALVLPESTSLAAANATTKLLRMMADAGSERNPDQTLSLLTAGEALTSRAPLTPQGGVALLDLFKTAMAASSHTNRPLSPQMSNTFANALTRGLDAATTTDEQAAAAAAAAADSAAKASKESGGRRKQQQKVQQQQHKEAKHPSRSLLPVTTGNNTKGALVLLSPDQAFHIIQDGAYKLAAAQKVTLGVVEPPVGNAGVCVGPALLSRQDVDGFTTEFDCKGVEAPAQVILPANFSLSCADSPDCKHSDDVLVMASYFSLGSRSVPVLLGVVSNANHLLSEDPKVTTEVISGVINVTLSYSGPAGAFCAGETFADVLAQGAGCKAELELPLTNGFDAGKTAACIQLLPDPEMPGRLKAGTIEPVLSIRDVEVSAGTAPATKGQQGSVKKGIAAAAHRPKKALATCKVARQGLWLVAQFDPREVQEEEGEGEQGGGMSKQLSNTVGATQGHYELVPGQFTEEEAPVNKKAAMSFTYTFSRDGEALFKSPLEAARFRTELQRAFLTGVVEAWTNGPDLADNLGALRLAHVVVTSVRTNSNGNTIADVTLLPPANTNPEQLAQLSLLPPAELLLSTSNLRKDLISSERSMATGANDSARSHKTLGGDAIIGVVIGCVGVVAAILAAVVVVIRRRATVNARGSTTTYSDDSESQARMALSAAGITPGGGGPSSSSLCSTPTGVLPKLSEITSPRVTAASPAALLSRASTEGWASARSSNNTGTNSDSSSTKSGTPASKDVRQGARL